MLSIICVVLCKVLTLTSLNPASSSTAASSQASLNFSNCSLITSLIVFPLPIKHLLGQLLIPVIRSAHFSEQVLVVIPAKFLQFLPKYPRFHQMILARWCVSDFYLGGFVLLGVPPRPAFPHLHVRPRENVPISLPQTFSFRRPLWIVSQMSPNSAPFLGFFVKHQLPFAHDYLCCQDVIQVLFQQLCRFLFRQIPKIAIHLRRPCHVFDNLQTVRSPVPTNFRRRYER